MIRRGVEGCQGRPKAAITLVGILRGCLAVFGRQTPDPTFLEAYLLGHHTKLLSCSGECPRSYAERSCVLFALLGGNRPFRQFLSQKLLGLRCCRTIPTCIGRSQRLVMQCLGIGAGAAL